VSKKSDKPSDYVLAILMLFVFAIGFIAGVFAGVKSVAFKEIEDRCEPCPTHIQMQCVRDNWSEEYAAGKCGKKED
jgi:hypothetical protein